MKLRITRHKSQILNQEGIFVYKKLLRNIRNELNRSKLINKNPTIIASNCNGAFLMHDLGLKFRTPTVNLYFLPKHFIKLVENLDYYISLELEKFQDNNLDYPVGKLDDVIIYFMHYKSFEEAKQKWNERKKRIDKSNIYIMMTDRDGCTYEDMKAFDMISYKNKVIFTKNKYDNIKSSYYIHGFEKEDSVGILSDYENKFAKRYLDQFDYISFLNQK